MANRRRRAWSLLWRSSVAALYVVGLILAVQVTHPAPESSSSAGAAQAAVSKPMATVSLEQRAVRASVEELPIVTLALAAGLMATAGTGWAVHPRSDSPPGDGAGSGAPSSAPPGWAEGDADRLNAARGRWCRVESAAHDQHSGAPPLRRGRCP